jgi:hypothetical protein
MILLRNFKKQEKSSNNPICSFLLSSSNTGGFFIGYKNPKIVNFSQNDLEYIYENEIMQIY